jgi:hypothetical protein
MSFFLLLQGFYTTQNNQKRKENRKQRKKIQHRLKSHMAGTHSSAENPSTPAQHCKTAGFTSAARRNKSVTK